jgi:hypothetical protein
MRDSCTSVNFFWRNIVPVKLSLISKRVYRGVTGVRVHQNLHESIETAHHECTLKPLRSVSEIAVTRQLTRRVATLVNAGRLMFTDPVPLIDFPLAYRGEKV